MVLGTRAAALAPVTDLGLVVVWDDGDDLHAEPRAPYPHVRDVLVLRAHLSGAAALLGGHARTAEGQALVDRGWARPVEADRPVVRAHAPRVDGTSDDDLARDPLAHAARLPALAFAAAREALAAGAPVLVQVPRRGYAPSLACARDRTPARCAACAGPLAAAGRGAVAACRWCGALAGRGAARPATAVRCGPSSSGPGAPPRSWAGRSRARRCGPPAGTRCWRRRRPHRSWWCAPRAPSRSPTAGTAPCCCWTAGRLLGRPDLRAGEEALRRWFGAAALARPAPDGGRVVVVADRGAARRAGADPLGPGGRGRRASSPTARRSASRRPAGWPPWTARPPRSPRSPRARRRGAPNRRWSCSARSRRRRGEAAARPGAAGRGRRLAAALAAVAGPSERPQGRAGAGRRSTRRPYGLTRT